jgi:ATP-dependent DNA helicase RecG
MATTALQDTGVDKLRGVGPQLAGKLQKLGLHSIQDLLFHLPLRYIDRTKITAIGGIQPLTEVVIEGEIRACDVVYGRRRSLVCRIQDHSGIITLRFFHFNQAQQQSLQAGTKLRCFGEVRRGKAGLEMYHPEYQHLNQAKPPALADTLTPIYPATEGVTQQRIRDLCAQALQRLDTHQLEDWLPADPGNQTLSQLLSYSLVDALRLLHNPPPGTALNLLAEGEHPAQQRLAAEELIAHNLSLLRLRQKIQQQAAPALAPNEAANQRFLEQLPFTLTAAQQRVADEISTDISQPLPMLRLVQGDVGSGKTVVAGLAAMQAIANGMQAALMAPTEILAEQHRVNFETWFRPLGIRIAWLTGKLKGKGREVQLGAIADGSAQIIIGTHALFQ